MLHSPVAGENRVFQLWPWECCSSTSGLCFCMVTRLGLPHPFPTGATSYGSLATTTTVGQRRKEINVQCHLIHPVLVKQSFSHFGPKEIFPHRVFGLLPVALQPLPPYISPRCHRLWLASNPKIPPNFPGSRALLSLYPFAAHPRYGEGGLTL